MSRSQGCKYCGRIVAGYDNWQSHEGGCKGIMVSPNNLVAIDSECLVYSHVREMDESIINRIADAVVKKLGSDES